MGDTYRAVQEVACVTRADLRWGRDEPGPVSGVYVPDKNGTHIFTSIHEIRAEAKTADEARARLGALVNGLLGRDSDCRVIDEEPKVEKVVPFWTRVWNQRVSDEVKNYWMGKM